MYSHHYCQCGRGLTVLSEERRPERPRRQSGAQSMVGEFQRTLYLPNAYVPHTCAYVPRKLLTSLSVILRDPQTHPAARVPNRNSIVSRFLFFFPEIKIKFSTHTVLCALTVNPAASGAAPLLPFQRGNPRPLRANPEAAVLCTVQSGSFWGLHPEMGPLSCPQKNVRNPFDLQRTGLTGLGEQGDLL